MSAVMKTRRRRTSVSVYVDIDLSDIDTEDLQAELDSRFERNYERPPSLDHIAALMRFGRNEEALSAMRVYLQDTLGCVLP